jgi:hypothetical protein
MVPIFCESCAECVVGDARNPQTVPQDVPPWYSRTVAKEKDAFYSQFRREKRDAAQRGDRGAKFGARTNSYRKVFETLGPMTAACGDVRSGCISCLIAR